MNRSIDYAKCIKCRMCELNCPMGLFELADDGMHFTSDADELCIMCGHCIAACPEDIIMIKELPGEMFPKTSGAATLEQLQALMDMRRSVRSFLDKPVEKDKIEKILQAVSTVPTGSARNPTPVTVINGREKLSAMVEPMMQFYRNFNKGMKSWLMKPVLRMMMGKHQYTAMIKFVPIMDRMLKYYEATKNDVLMWGAPALLLFHTPPDDIGSQYDPIISCTYAMLAAHAQGLGTTMIGMVPPYLNKKPEVKKQLGIPEENIVSLTLILGYSNVNFARGIRRKMNANWV